MSFSIAALSWRECKSLGASGLKFFSLQASTAALGQLPAILMAAYAGAAAVSGYAIANRMALVAPMALSLAVQPLWPAYADARARNERQWIRRAFLSSFAVTILGCLVLVPAFWFGIPRFVVWWIGPEALSSKGVLAAVIVFSVGNCLHWTTSAYLNGCGLLKQQLMIQLFGLAAAVVSTMLLGSHYGAAGVAAAFGASELFVGLAQIYQVRAHLAGEFGILSLQAKAA